MHTSKVIDNTQTADGNTLIILQKRYLSIRTCYTPSTTTVEPGASLHIKQNLHTQWI